MNKKDVKINLDRFFGFKDPHVNRPGTDGHTFEIKLDWSCGIWLKDPTRSCLIGIK